jgi:hypothetical protein
MKIINLLLSATVLFACLTGTAVAEPKNGFSLNAGSASHTMTPQGSSTSYSTSGLSLGMDYQIALANRFSVNPFLMTSGESTNVSGLTAAHGILALQLRYWAGNMFFGGHVGNYSEVQTLTVGPISVTSSGTGGGAGLVAGWENPNGGFYAMGQLDSANIKYSTAETKLAGFRLSVGYRWK